MAQGLQCFDNNGNKVLDVTDRLTRVLGTFDTGTSNGSISDTNLANGIPWYITQNSAEAKWYGKAPFSVNISSNNISWTFGDGTIVSRKIIYGVY